MNLNCTCVIKSLAVSECKRQLVRQRTVPLNCREAMSRMKEGEEEKTKSYTALIWTQKPIQREDITFIDDIKVVTAHTHIID